MSDLEQQPEPMAETAVDQPSLSRRHILMGAAMLAAGGAAYARMPKRRFKPIPDATFDAMFPKSFGDWRILPSSEVVLPPDSDFSDKLYEHIVTRTYMNRSGGGVMFLVAYNSEQVNNVQVHRPEICYAASGFAIQDSRPYDVPLANGRVIPARIVRAERTLRTENIVYWTRIGDDFPQSWLDQRLAMTKANLEGFFADGLLFRVSSIDQDESRSVELVTRFIRDMAAHGSQPMRYLAFRA